MMKRNTLSLKEALELQARCGAIQNPVEINSWEVNRDKYLTCGRKFATVYNLFTRFFEVK